jgi:hypothetical protein
MLFFIVIVSYSLKYIYLRVYLLMLDLIPLYFFVVAWVFSVMCKVLCYINVVVIISFVSFVSCLPLHLRVIYAADVDVYVPLLHACYL